MTIFQFIMYVLILLLLIIILKEQLYLFSLSL